MKTDDRFKKYRRHVSLELRHGSSEIYGRIAPTSRSKQSHSYHNKIGPTGAKSNYYKDTKKHGNYDE